MYTFSIIIIVTSCIQPNNCCSNNIPSRQRRSVFDIFTSRTADAPETVYGPYVGPNSGKQDMPFLGSGTNSCNVTTRHIFHFNDTILEHTESRPCNNTIFSDGPQTIHHYHVKSPEQSPTMYAPADPHGNNHSNRRSRRHYLTEALPYICCGLVGSVAIIAAVIKRTHPQTTFISAAQRQI